MNLLLPSPLEKLDIVLNNNVKLYLKRDDLIHQYISGNKWRKLKYNISDLLKQKKQTILTVGGAFSNHIMATAAAANLHAINSIGIIRGEELNVNSNDNLAFASAQGMQLFFVDRNTYNKRYDSNFAALICEKFNLNINDIYFVPEGGANELAKIGCKEIIDEIDLDFNYIVSACGTGTTLAGLAQNLLPHQKAIGIDVLKNNYELDKTFAYNSSIDIIHDYHFGGYAKKDYILQEFIYNFYTQYHIKLDYVYTGKMMYALLDLIQNNYFKPNSTIVALHTGGILNASIFNEV